MVPNLFLVEWAVTNLAIQGPLEIPLIIDGPIQALIVEQIVHPPTLQVEPLAHEPVRYLRSSVRLVWLGGEYWDFRHKLVPYRAGYMVRVELRLGLLLVVWRAQCFAVSLDQERHSLLESHDHDLDFCSRRRQTVDCVGEVWPIAE